jgi:hypothetical protein
MSNRQFMQWQAFYQIEEEELEEKQAQQKAELDAER